MGNTTSFVGNTTSFGCADKVCIFNNGNWQTHVILCYDDQIFKPENCDTLIVYMQIKEQDFNRHSLIENAAQNPYTPSKKVI